MALKSSRLCAFLRGMACFFFALTSAWLFVSSVIFTNHTAASGGNSVSPDRAWLQCLVFGSVCLLLFLWSRSGSQVLHCEKRLDFPRLFLVYAAGALSAVWIFCVQAAPTQEALYAQTAAFDLTYGHTYLFQPGEYMYLFPLRAGLSLLHFPLQQVNPNTTLPFQVLNILFYIGILYLLGDLAQELGLSGGGRLAATATGTLFLPLFFTVTSLTGTMPGLFFSMAGLTLSLRYCRGGKWYQAACASILLFLAVIVRPDYQIFLICLLLYALLSGIRGKKRRLWLVAGLLLAWILGLRLPSLLWEKWTGIALNGGVTPAAQLAAGLRSDSTFGPGWHSDYVLESYFRANMDPNAQRAMAADCISGILQGYLMNPKSMITFFAQKNATQWSDPLFQSLWNNLIGHNASSVSVPAWTEAFLNSQGSASLNGAMNLFQTLSYGGLVLWAWMPAGKKQQPAEALLAAILLGGFAFYSFWAADSLNTLPYFVLSLPLAVLGYGRLAALAKNPEATVLWHSVSGKVRFLMPVLLMLLALVLSVVLSGPMHENLLELLRFCGKLA